MNTLPALGGPEPQVDSEHGGAELLRLQALNHDLLVMLGHELGSPLTILLAYLRLWQERESGVDRAELNSAVQQAMRQFLCPVVVPGRVGRARP
jgi:hypothetical protein